MYYSVIGVLALLILLTENQDIISMSSESFNRKSWKVYRRFLFTVMLYYITDILWGVLSYYKLATALYWDTVIYFIMMSGGILFWSQFVVIYLEENNEFGYLLITAGHTAATLIAISSIINIFVPMLFTVDSDGVYHVQGLRNVVLGIQIIILIVISIYAFLALIRKKIRSSKVRRYRMVALFGLIMAFFLIVQLMFPYLPVYSIAYMLGTCLIRAYVISDEKEEHKTS